MRASFFSDFLNLFFPETCIGCSTNLRYSEKILCTQCLLDLPRIYPKTKQLNPLEDLLVGQFNFEFAHALFHYTKDKTYSKLLYNLKYNNRPDIGVYLGELLAVQIEEMHKNNSVDCIVPVPLHSKRLHKRGYNQSEEIAKGISNVLSIPIKTNDVLRKVHTQTQTSKSREERLNNVANIFAISNNSTLESKHVLLIDDVITTGATIISCALAILKASPNTKISICSIGLA